MNKSLKLLLATLLIGGSALSLSSCKDSENVSDGPTPEEMAQSKESDTAKDLLSVLSFTSELDSLPDNWYSNNYTVEPTIGVVNDASTPYVRYVPVLNKEEAIAKYNSIANEIISEDATSASWNIENVGSLKFSVLNQSDVTATLDVSIKQQPHLTQIRFVPASVLGNNATLSGTPYYSFGDVVQLTEGGNKSYWICVRPCSQIEEKGKSHWMSFNLNDWDSQEKNGVPKESVNMIKLPKSGCSDYFLPTQLGNKSESREHLQNLFKLLMILDSPAKYANFPDGIGGIGTGELTKGKVEEISSFWEREKCWENVLPSHVARVDIAKCLNGNAPEVNVFYHGYHTWLSTASVHRAQLQGKNLSLAADGELKWTRNAAAVDFHDYANYGVSHAENEMPEGTGLPETGFIVRYKTGRQLVGQSGRNDEDATHSFEDKHPNTLKDIYVYNNFKETADMGASVIGDYLQDVNDKQYCVLSYAKDNPDYLGNNSYYICPRINDRDHSNQKIVLQNLEISTLAYINLLNAFICKNGLNRYTNFDAKYIDGLNMLIKNMNNFKFYYDNNWENIIEFRLVDTNGQIMDISNGNTDNLAKVILNMPYKDNTTGGKIYKLATLEYDIKDKTYTVIPHGLDYDLVGHRYILELYAYTDLGTKEPSVGIIQLFTTGIKYKDRSSVKKACSDFLKDVLSRINKKE